MLRMKRREFDICGWYQPIIVSIRASFFDHTEKNFLLIGSIIESNRTKNGFHAVSIHARRHIFMPISALNLCFLIVRTLKRNSTARSIIRCWFYAYAHKTHAFYVCKRSRFPYLSASIVMNQNAVGSLARLTQRLKFKGIWKSFWPKKCVLMNQKTSIHEHQKYLQRF
jgi:hypothetical protein